MSKDPRYDVDVFVDNAKEFNIAKIPCARDAFLQGGFGGLLSGTFRFIQTKRFRAATNFAVGGFVAFGIGSFEFCRYQKRKRDEQIRQALDKINEKEMILAGKRKEHPNEG